MKKQFADLDRKHTLLAHQTWRQRYSFCHVRRSPQTWALSSD
jgi:hypothetical protein